MKQIAYLNTIAVVIVISLALALTLALEENIHPHVYITGFYGSGGSGSDLEIYDKDGNVIKTLTDENEDNRTSFLVKYDKDGNVIWAAKQEGSKSSEGRGIFSDNKGNVYITGFYGFGEGDFDIYDKDGNVVKTLTDENLDEHSSFLIKYDKYGNVLWAAKQEGSVDSSGYTVTSDIKGDVYITGYYGFGGSDLKIYDKDGNVVKTLTDENGSYSSSFLIKYDRDGNVLWAAKQEGSANNVGYTVSSDIKGDVYITGHYGTGGSGGDLKIYDKDGNVVKTLTDENTNVTSSFIIKYDKDGNVLWAAKQEGPNTNAANIVSSDAKENLYTTGYHAGGGSGVLKIYDKDGNVVKTFDGSGSDSFSFLVKYDRDGNVLWAAKQEGSVDNAGGGASSDSKDNIYITGSYTLGGGKLDIYDKDGNLFRTLTDTNTSESSSFLIKYDKDGNVLWAAKQEGLSSGANTASGTISSDSKDNIYITGTHNLKGSNSDLKIYDRNDNVTRFLPYPRGNFISTFDAITAKYDKDGNVLWAAKQEGRARPFAASAK